ncbi:MAG: S-layer homology domain-containing protein [Eubacteriales bacterium]|nr:S-layer homology domain-containing protein [Eubacteriales bacterium]
MKKQILAASLAALMAASALPIAACAAISDDRTPAGAPSLNTTDHGHYLNGYPDGTFRPDAALTRAEACQMLAGLLAAPSGGGDYFFSDVPQGAWFAEAVSELTGFSLVNGFADGTFRPHAKITRAAFVTMLSRLPHTDIGIEKAFADVPASHWAHRAVQTALAQGWIAGDPSGRFRPDDPLTRAEAVTILNRVLGRKGDAVTAATGAGIRIMPDVPDTHWAYLAMLEATTDHQYDKAGGIETWTDYEQATTPLAPGWHNIGGWLFHVDEAQRFDRSTVIDGLELDRNGRYTTGSSALDAQLASAVGSTVTDGLTQPDKLRAVYDYAKRTFGYLGIGEVDTTAPGWAIEQATQMLRTGRGNCYSWAAVFTYLARQVGYEAEAVVGTGISPKGSESVHAWTEITIDGVPYTFDPQIESVYAARYGEQYDLFMKPYGEAVWGYQKAEQPAQPDAPQPPEVDAALAALMDKVYGDDPYGAQMMRVPLYKGMGADGTSQPLTWFLGTEDVAFEAGLASEPMINAQAHSIVLLRLADAADAAAVKATLRDSIDPFKWICVGVDPANVKIDSVGDLVCVILDDEQADTYLANFRAHAAA